MGRAAWAWCCTGWLASSVALGQGGGERYVVDATQSDLHWLVFRAGALAGRGHNHVISVGDLTGSVTVDQNDLGASRFELEFPVASLVVDDMKLRGTLGAEFSSVPTAKDVAGTKTNMLSGRVLDAEKHPRIRIVGTGPGWRDGRTVLSVKVEMLGRTLDLTVPAEVTIANDELRANGEFQLDHADLGLQPFSVMGGALRVGEQLSFVYDIKARQAAR